MGALAGSSGRIFSTAAADSDLRISTSMAVDDVACFARSSRCSCMVLLDERDRRTWRMRPEKATSRAWRMFAALREVSVSWI